MEPTKTATAQPPYIHCAEQQKRTVKIESSDLMQRVERAVIGILLLFRSILPQFVISFLEDSRESLKGSTVYTKTEYDDKLPKIVTPKTLAQEIRNGLEKDRKEIKNKFLSPSPSLIPVSAPRSSEISKTRSSRFPPPDMGSSLHGSPENTGVGIALILSQLVPGSEKEIQFKEQFIQKHVAYQTAGCREEAYYAKQLFIEAHIAWQKAQTGSMCVSRDMTETATLNWELLGNLPSKGAQDLLERLTPYFEQLLKGSDFAFEHHPSKKTQEERNKAIQAIVRLFHPTLSPSYRKEFLVMMSREGSLEISRKDFATSLYHQLMSQKLSADEIADLTRRLGLIFKRSV